jgi:hypothetical protein
MEVFYLPGDSPALNPDGMANAGHLRSGPSWLSYAFAP